MKTEQDKIILTFSIMRIQGLMVNAYINNENFIENIVEIYQQIVAEVFDL